METLVALLAQTATKRLLPPTMAPLELAASKVGHLLALSMGSLALQHAPSASQRDLQR